MSTNAACWGPAAAGRPHQPLKRHLQLPLRPGRVQCCQQWTQVAASPSLETQTASTPATLLRQLLESSGHATQHS
jgi:hypothetical protein